MSYATHAPGLVRLLRSLPDTLDEAAVRDPGEHEQGPQTPGVLPPQGHLYCWGDGLKGVRFAALPVS